MTRPSKQDSGFTLVELVISLGVFSLLMAMVTVLTIQGLKTVRIAGEESQIQASQQIVLQQISRQLRYIDSPQRQSLSDGLLCAHDTAATFFTFSGSAQFDRVPYLVNIRQAPSAANESWVNIEMSVWSPTSPDPFTVDPGSSSVIDGFDPTNCVPLVTENNDAYSSAHTTRPLIFGTHESSPSLIFNYETWTEDGTWETIVGQGDGVPLSDAELAEVRSVTATITDSRSLLSVHQNVVLENLT